MSLSLTNLTQIRKALLGLQARMNLLDWQISLADEPADEEYGAFIRWIPGTREATLFIGPDWPTFTPLEQLQNIVHELVHLHLADLCDVMTHDMPDLLGRPVWSGVYKQWVRSMERSVDGLAWAFAKEMS